MTRDDEQKKEGRETPEPMRPSDERVPWWADNGPDPDAQPPGFPERPDLRKVHELRGRMHRERAAREEAGRSRLTAKFNARTGRQARELGSYTLIPTMMLAGPAVGYGLGWLLEKKFGGHPWVSVFGILFGLAAAFQQIILLLKKNAERKD